MYRLVLILTLVLASVGGCRQKPAKQPPEQEPSWDRLVKGYGEPKAHSIWDQRAKQFHIRQDDDDGHVFEYTLAVGPYEDLPADKAAINAYWGMGSREDYRDRMGPSSWEQLLKQRAHVQEISLILDSRPVQIPKAAYIDLVDLDTARPDILRGEGLRYFLYVDGSDAGESYRVKFTIEDYRVTKRELWHGECPEFGHEAVTFGPDGTVISRTFIDAPAASQEAKP